jgi:hypothetical protein
VRGERRGLALLRQRRAQRLGELRLDRARRARAREAVPEDADGHGGPRALDSLPLRETRQELARHGRRASLGILRARAPAGLGQGDQREGARLEVAALVEHALDRRAQGQILGPVRADRAQREHRALHERVLRARPGVEQPDQGGAHALAQRRRALALEAGKEPRQAARAMGARQGVVALVGQEAEQELELALAARLARLVAGLRVAQLERHEAQREHAGHA